MFILFSLTVNFIFVFNMKFNERIKINENEKKSNRCS